ncbi:MAG: (Fe-S)-binding protein [Betaproteobacteria bacterium]|nr:(Fe-S)-binding protein [Betaproteobacteria bacterium]
MKNETEQLLSYIESNIARTLADCTTCGKCFDACPMTQYSDKLTGKTGGQVVTGIRALLAGETATTEALEWTRLCTQSARCVPACPEKVNPMLMMRLARITALGSTGGPALMADGKRDPNFFRRINAFSALQFSDAEVAAWQR